MKTIMKRLVGATAICASSLALVPAAFAYEAYSPSIGQGQNTDWWSGDVHGFIVNTSNNSTMRTLTPASNDYLAALFIDCTSEDWVIQNYPFTLYGSINPLYSYTCPSGGTIWYTWGWLNDN